MNKINTAYEDLLRQVIADGTLKTDRTGTGTVSLFGPQMRFDLQEGFPLITTKKVHMKSIIYELLWFLQGNSNVAWLQEHGVKIWNEWADSNGNLGPVYGVLWRYAPAESFNDIIQVKKRTDDYKDFIYSFKELEPAIDCDLNTEEMWAVEKFGTDKNHKNTSYRVQFKSGYITTISRPNWKTLKNTQSSDRYKKSIFGVGFLGEKVEASEKLYNLWRNMMVRCYNPNNPSYKFYGARGVTVSPIWHSFENFVKTIGNVPLYHLWNNTEGQYDLDKDYFGSQVYSPSTTIFLQKQVNARISSDGSAIQVKNVKYSDWAHFQLLSGLRADNAKSRLMNGKTYKDYSPEDVVILKSTENSLWRPRVYYDQIADVIDQIKVNPDSRRLIVSAWDPAALPFQALPACHAFFQFYVADGKLSCQLYQRSGDLFLGVPFNIASYSLLTHMIAQQTGLEVGEFVWTGGDTHIYSNHMEQVAEQLSREARPFPTLKLKKRDSIDDYEFEDFEIVGYDPHPAIRAQVAV